jgi:hypothetical protein
VLQFGGKKFYVTKLNLVSDNQARKTKEDRKARHKANQQLLEEKSSARIMMASKRSNSSESRLIKQQHVPVASDRSHFTYQRVED